jgi:hypothetical protein
LCCILEEAANYGTAMLLRSLLIEYIDGAESPCGQWIGHSHSVACQTQVQEEKQMEEHPRRECPPPLRLVQQHPEWTAQ